MSQLTDEEYFARIEQHFGQRRGGPLMLSPNDWQLVQRWHRKRIPLRVVLRGINQTFDHFEASGPRSDRVNSLRYCAQQVEAAWEEYRATHDTVGEGAVAASPRLPSAGPHLRAVAAACRTAAEEGFPHSARDALFSAADQLERLAAAADAGEVDARQLDESATALEELLRTQLAAAAALAPLQETALVLPRFSPYNV